MFDPQYLEGDSAALAQYDLELIDCDVCESEFDRAEYRSDTCSKCEDEGK